MFPVFSLFPFQCSIFSASFHCRQPPSTTVHRRWPLPSPLITTSSISLSLSSSFLPSSSHCCFVAAVSNHSWRYGFGYYCFSTLVFTKLQLFLVPSLICFLWCLLLTQSMGGEGGRNAGKEKKRGAYLVLFLSFLINKCLLSY